MTSLYSNKQFLAPMVRICSLPMRLAALDYGADMVYSEETIDLKIIGSERVENKELGTIDYMREGRVMFRTHPSEKDRLIFQIGSSDPQLALKAALTVKQDVAAIDLNCGCPKHFSVHKGMGAALLSTPDLLVEILETLVKNVELPISCKIRVFEDMEKTIELVKRLESTGIKAIGVHCRTRYMKRGEPGMWEVFEPIVKALKIPVIANGDIFTQKDRQEILKTGVSSVMFARAAQDNVSVFRPEGRLPGSEVAKRFLYYSVKYDNPYQNCKYTLATMRYGDKTVVAKITRAKSLSDLCDVFGLDDLKQAAELKVPLALYDDMFPYIPDAPDLSVKPKRKFEEVENDVSKINVN